MPAGTSALRPAHPPPQANAPARHSNTSADRIRLPLQELIELDPDMARLRGVEAGSRFGKKTSDRPANWLYG
jgi:hypothetical protein